MFSAVALATVSCSEDVMDDINKNENNPAPELVPSKYMFTDIQNQLAVNIIGGDPTFYAMSYIEQEVGIYNQLYNAEIRAGEPSASSTYNNSWATIYANLEALKQIEEKCADGSIDTGNKLNLGVAQVLRALTLATLTDCWGDTPWSEALKIKEGVYQPKLDSQESIYADIIANLDAAIANISSGEVGNNPLDAAHDMIYGQYSNVSNDEGRAEAYIKFAYSLKARYLLRQSKIAVDYDAVLDAVSKGFASSDEEAKVSVFNGNTSVSPYCAFYYSRDYMAASESFVGKMTERNDPRASEILFETYPWGAEYYANGLAPNGAPVQLQYYYTLPLSAEDGAAPVLFMSYHELMFIKAEALLAKGDAAGAKAALAIAVENAMVKTSNATTRVLGGSNIDAAAIADYITNEVNPRFDANAKKELALQKYMGLYQDGESLEAYHDVRRNIAMGNNVYGFQNPKAERFPLRFSYGGDDVTTNTNVNAAYGDGTYVYTENVWWAGGSR